MSVRLGAGDYDPLVVPGDDTRYGARYHAARHFLKAVGRLYPKVLDELAAIPLSRDEWDLLSAGGVIGTSTPHGWRSRERFTAFVADVRAWALHRRLCCDFAVAAGAQTRIALAAGRLQVETWEFPGMQGKIPPTALDPTLPDPFQESREQSLQRWTNLWDARVRELGAAGYPPTLLKTAPQHFEWLARYQVGDWTEAKIAERYQDSRGRPDVPGVSRALNGLARLIGLTLRPARGRSRKH